MEENKLLGIIRKLEESVLLYDKFYIKKVKKSGRDLRKILKEVRSETKELIDQTLEDEKTIKK